MEKRIPEKALEPLTRLSKLISVTSGREASASSVFKHLLEIMDLYADYFFRQSWPKEYNFEAATRIKEADVNFMTEGEEDEFLDRLYVICLKKNMNLEGGFSPLGFLWTLWSLKEKFAKGYAGGLGRLKEDASLFAQYLLGWHPFPYQEKLLLDQAKRIVCCWGRQCGKTSTIAVKAIHFAYSNPNMMVLITSPSLRQSMIMFDRIQGFITGNSLLSNGVARKTRTVIQLLNKSSIIALPCSENLLRGYTAHLIIADEAAFMPEEVITQIVFPMLSTTDGSAIFISTPWGRDHFFYRAFMDPSYSVHHVKSTECPLIKPEFLEEQRHNMAEEAFRMEYLAEFAEAATCFLTQDLIRGCIDPDMEFIHGLDDLIPSGEYYAGVDFGKLEDYSVIAILRREDELLKLVYLYEFPLGTPYSHVIGHLVIADRRLQLRKTYIDQTGIGEPVLEELKFQGVGNVEGLTFTVKTKEELLTCLKLAMEQGRLKMPYSRRICEQLNQQQYEYSKSGHLTFSHPAGSHDDQLWSLALSCYAATVGREPSRKLIRVY